MFERRAAAGMGLFLLGLLPAAPGGASEAGSRMDRALAALAGCSAATERRAVAEAGAEAARAEEELRGILAEEPGRAEAHLALARTLLQCRIAEAPMMEKAGLLLRIEEHLGAVLEIDPDHWEAHYLYGTMLYHVPPFLGRAEDAARHLRAAIALQEAGRGPARAEPYLLLGDLERRLGREDEARAAWRRGIDRHPEDPALRERLEPAPAADPEPEPAVRPEPEPEEGAPLAVPAVSDPAGTTYAAGLRVAGPQGRRVIRHSGGINGFLSELAYYPDSGLAVVVLANSEAAEPTRLASELAGLLLEEREAPAPAPALR